MKNLLRMSLFIIARAGLFLAVVAWIAGQWWTLLMTPGFGTDVFLKVDADAARLWTYDGLNTGLHISLDGLSPGDSEPAPDIWWQYTLSESSAPIQIRHWLTITLFTAFNIVLHFIYRKRPESKLCEV